jgi:hypothetical protein
LSSHESPPRKINSDNLRDADPLAMGGWRLASR